MAAAKEPGSYHEHGRLIDLEDQLESSEHDNIFDFIKHFEAYDSQTIVIARDYDLARSFKLWWHTRGQDEKINILNTNLTTLKQLDSYTYRLIVNTLEEELQQFANSDACKDPFRAHLQNILGTTFNRPGYLITLTYLLIFERDFNDNANDAALLTKNQQRLLGAAKQHPSFGNRFLYWSFVSIAMISLAVLATALTLTCIYAPAPTSIVLDKSPLLLPALAGGAFATLCFSPFMAYHFKHHGLAQQITQVINAAPKASLNGYKSTFDEIYLSNNSDARHTPEQAASQYDELKNRLKVLIDAADKGALPPQHFDPSGSSPFEKVAPPAQGNPYSQPQPASGQGNYYDQLYPLNPHHLGGY